MKLNYLKQGALAVVLSSAVAGLAMTPAELLKQQADEKKITIIDLRNNEAFKTGHIPNAINVPASIVAQKTLPPLGKVVVYDDGLGRDSVDAAVAALNQKNGIEAEALEGGFAAWEMSRAATTAVAGMERERISYITYDDLKKSQADDLVIVDLRQVAKSAGKNSAAAKSAVSQNSFSDLSKEFPNARITKSPLDNAQKGLAGRNGAASNPPLLVLIDNGDGSAQAMARTLKGNGQTRVVILAGGEEIIARGGQAGLQRQGYRQEVFSTNAPTSQSK